METRELTCIGCPLGCQITVTLDGSGIREVKGYTCKRGEQYARKEVTNPTRIVTTSVPVSGSRTGMKTVSCKTARDIPKDRMLAVAACLKNVTAAAPVHIGDVILENAAGTGVPVIATRNVD